MKFFSGFCLKDEKELFKEYLDECDLCVAGFSKGAILAVEYALKNRVKKLQLFSPAFFTFDKRIIKLNIDGFKKDKNSYIKRFLKKAGLYEEKYIDNCSEEELKMMFEYDWNRIKSLKADIEIYIGIYDKIIDTKKAIEFFKDVGVVYLLKANHFLKEISG